MKFLTPRPALALTVLALAACHKPTPPTVPPPSVRVAPVLSQDVTAFNQWVGLLDGFQNANIQAQVTGYLLTQNYQEGSAVKKGDILFTIDQRPFQAALAQAEADYASAVAKAQLQQITLQRQQQLYQTKVISEQEYQTSYQNTQAALAEVAANQASVQAAQVNVDYCTITAPFDGIAGLAQAQIGDLVGPGGRVAILTQMSQIDPMKFNFSITESEYLGSFDLLQRIQAMPVSQRKARLNLKLADGTAYPQPGTFDFFNRQVNSSTGTIQITALFPNPDGFLRPGLFATVKAPVKDLPGSLLVPQKALVEMQGAWFVSIVDADNSVRTLPVRLGPAQNDLRVVKGDLKPGENVIIEGVEKARPGMKVTILPPEASTPQAASKE